MKRTNKKNTDLRRKFLDGIGVPKQSNDFVPDDFQVEAIESLRQGFDTLVVAPTGSGKTYIAREGIAHAVLNGKRAMYTAPLKALSNTKFIEFKEHFEPNVSVGLLTGDRKINGDADVIIATTEIYRNELYRYTEDYGVVVLDEIHYLADPQRGPVWEESIILSARSSALLMLSASISNADDITDWMKEIRGKEVKIVYEKERPVELRLGFLHPEEGLLPLEGKPDKVQSEIASYYARGGSSRRSDGRGGGGRRYRGRKNK